MSHDPASPPVPCDDTFDFHRIVGEHLDVTVKAQGAELASLRHRELGEFLWQAEPAWPQHAPNLFPIVGQVAGDVLRVDGRSYPLKRHGFARNRRFTWLEAHDTGCRLILRDDEATRAVFPFAFAFEIGYEIVDATLNITYVVRNTGMRTLPASVGAHPAFRWPLANGIAKNAHTLEFAEREPAPIRRLHDGLLQLERFPTPIDGRILTLSPDLFAADAIVMDDVASHALRYTAQGAPAIDVAWEGFRELGIWSKGDADFVCIEPWHGYASPVDFDGPFEEKPGLMLLAPGEERRLSIAVSIKAGDGTN